MKKAFALFLALCMMFALCACGQTEAPAQPETPAEPQTETPAEAPAETTGWAPNGPVTMIVAYKAGNGTDVTARILAQYAEKYVGQTIVIENVDGGSGSIGWSQLAESEPDGMTIGFMNLPNFNSSIVKGLGTYTTADFAAICNHVTETSLVLVRADDERFNDIDDLVAYARKTRPSPPPTARRPPTTSVRRRSPTPPASSTSTCRRATPPMSSPAFSAKRPTGAWRRPPISPAAPT